MTKRKKRNLSVDDIQDLFNRAEEYSIYIDEEGAGSKSFDAFLMLATLFEAVKK